ncbi:hypothetical protein OESDEN_17161, partial [Oesophagostomum dentatum]
LQAKYGDIETYVVKLDKFYQAEDYHQKYWLRNRKDIFDALKLNDAEVANSVLAAKMNAYCAGYTDFSELEELKREHGLSDSLVEKMNACCPGYTDFSELEELKREHGLSDSLVEKVKNFATSGGDPRACH